jgi:hypothetical protein
MYKEVSSAADPVADSQDRVSFAVAEINPDDIHLQGIFVSRVVELDRAHAFHLSIEKLTTQAHRGAGGEN